VNGCCCWKKFRSNLDLLIGINNEKRREESVPLDQTTGTLVNGAQEDIATLKMESR
jgi:hypothetical protein